VVGFPVFLDMLPRPFLSLGVLIALAGWVGMQNIGGSLTGSTTDVGTGPVLVLVALAFWPLSRISKRGAAPQRTAGEPRPAASQREAQPAAGGTRPADPATKAPPSHWIRSRAAAGRPLPRSCGRDPPVSCAGTPTHVHRGQVFQYTL
jgi:hypothetical protein